MESHPDFPRGDWNPKADRDFCEMEYLAASSGDPSTDEWEAKVQVKLLGDGTSETLAVSVLVK